MGVLLKEVARSPVSPTDPRAALNRSKLCVLSLRSEIGRPGATRGSRRRAPEGMAPMHKESSDSQAGDDARLERAIVLELLSDSEQGGRSRAELGETLGADPVKLEAALLGLHAAGVLELDAGYAQPSSATRRLDELELIGI
jgi:hypothetical protein